jgi:hypothetical protein
MMSSNTAGGLARRLVWGGGLAVLLGSGALLLHAFNPQPDPPGVYAVVGINPVETLRFHVSNIGGTAGSPPDPCKVQLGFLNMAGGLIKSNTVTLNPGQSTFLDLTFADMPSATVGANRMQARPVFFAGPTDSCYADSSAEVFETSSGQSRIFALPSLQHQPAATTTTTTTTAAQ